MDNLEPNVRDSLIKYMKTKGRKYSYFLTWTTKPDCKFDDVIGKFNYFVNESKFKTSIEKLCYVDEHLDTNPHRHCYIVLNEPLMQRNMKCYEKFGHINRQRAKGTEAEIMDYMSKDGVVSVVS